MRFFVVDRMNDCTLGTGLRRVRPANPVLIRLIRANPGRIGHTNFEIVRDCTTSIDEHCGSNVFLCSFYDIPMMLGSKEHV